VTILHISKAGLDVVAKERKNCQKS